MLHAVKRITTDIVGARAISYHIPTFLEGFHKVRMYVKLIIFLGIVAIVRYEDDTVVTHGLDDVFQIVSTRRHVLQQYPILELTTIAHHNIEREGVEQPVSGASFLETVTILNVIAESAAAFDINLKQFLDGMEIIDEGTARKFRSLAQLRVQPSALNLLQGDATPVPRPVDGFHEPDIFVQLIDSHIV